MEENKNNLWEQSETQSEKEKTVGNPPDFYEEEEIESLEVTKEEVDNFLGEGDQLRNNLDDLVTTTDKVKLEQNNEALEAQAPSLDYGTTNIMKELHNAEKQAQQEYAPLSGQTLPIQPPTQSPQSNYVAASEQPLQQPQYSQPTNPTQTSQQGQPYPGLGTVSGQPPYNQGQPQVGQQNYYGQPLDPTSGGHQQNVQQGQPYQGAPEYKDYSVFYQNQTGQQQGQQGQQGQYSNQYNQQQYTQQSGQSQQNHQAPGQGYYQNNQYYPNPQIQKSSADGMAIASLVLGAFSIIGNFAIDMIGFSFIGGIVGLILGIISRNKTKSTMSLIGIILSAVGIAITVIMMIACVACIGSLMSYGFDDGINPWSYF